MIKYRCPHCQQKLGVPDEYAGRRIRCSKCTQPSVVPRKIIPVARPVQNAPANVPVAAAAKGASAPAPSQSVTAIPDVPDLVSENELPQVLEEDPNTAIWRDFRASQARKIDLKIPSGRRPDRRGKGKSPRPGRSKEGGGFPTGGLIPDVLRTPLAFLLAFGLVGGLILTWIAVAKTADSSMSFFAALIPLAGAAALRIIPNRGTAVGFLAVILGVVGIGAGKAAVAKWRTIPMFERRANEQVFENLPALLHDKNLQIPPDKSAKQITQNQSCMMCVALAHLVDQNQADPKEAQALAHKLLRESGAGASFTEAVSSIGASDASAESRMEHLYKRLEGNVLYEKASSLMRGWEDADTLRMARQYYPAYARLMNQARLRYNLEHNDDLFKFAFIASLIALDMIWIALGVGGAFVLTGLD